MKRSLAALLCLALLAASLTTPIHAEQVAPHLVSVPLYFRTTGLYATLASLDPSRAKRLTGTVGYVDSAGYCRSSAAGYDTTTGIPLVGIFRGTAAAQTADSTLLGRLVIQEAAGANWNSLTPQVLKGLDSIYVSVEVSAGGAVPRWTRVATLLPMVYAVADTTTGRVATYKLTQAAVASNTIAMTGLGGWPFIRFIITNDYNTATSCMEAVWQYFSSNTQDNK